MIHLGIQAAARALTEAVANHGPYSDQAADAESALLGGIFGADLRPDYVKCVRKADSNSVCGRSIAAEFAFLDWAHADGNEQNRGRLLTCPTCKAVRAALREVFG